MIIDLARKIIDLSQSRSKIGFQPFPPGDHRRRLPGTESKKGDPVGFEGEFGGGTGTNTEMGQP